MIQFNGQLNWKLSMKPVKWMMKMWCLCDANIGYCITFRVCTGREENADMDLGYRVIMGLMQPYLGKNHHIFADNYFTSVHLSEALICVSPLARTARNSRNHLRQDACIKVVTPCDSEATDENERSVSMTLFVYTNDEISEI